MNAEIGLVECPTVQIVGCLACMFRDGSLRNRAVALRDGHVELRRTEACLKEYVEVARGEPGR